MKYFTEEEFQNCNPSCSMSQMDEEFLAVLDKLRERAGIPIVLNCAYRSKEHELSLGRSGNSAHTKGKAADIRVTTSRNRMLITKAAISMGIPRIGIGENFIHIDIDDSLPQDVIWTYY